MSVRAPPDVHRARIDVTAAPNLLDLQSARRRWLHLPVEVKVRGFQSRLLLAFVAAERGYGAVVGMKSHLADRAIDLPTGIYLEKSCQRPADGYRARSAMGHAVCCLDEEGVVYVDADEYAATRLATESLDALVRFFAWGDDQAGVVARFHPPTADRIRVTGNPRVDLWRPELRTIYQREADALRAEHGSFVLVPTAFAMVNNTRGPDYHRRTVAANGMLDSEAGAARLEGYLSHSRSIFEGLCKAVVRLAEAVPDRLVIVRPHPSEDVGPWEQAASSADNLVVLRDGPVTPWLLAADAIVHSNCTTGLEGFLMGRPTIAFAPRQDVRYDQNIPNRVSQLTPDEDTLIDLVRSNLAGQVRTAEAGVEVVQRHIAALDGRFAADRLVDAFDEIDVPLQRLGTSPIRRASRELRRGPDRLRRLVATRRHPSATDAATSTPSPPTAKFPRSSLAEVNDLLTRLRGATGRFGDVTCYELGRDVYAVVAPSSDHDG
jgi:surface carbohydrate biosynthesis protein